MRKIVFLFMLLIFSSIIAKSQAYIVIKHIGNSDRFIPALAIKTGYINNDVIFDTNSRYGGASFNSIIELSKKKYSIIEHFMLTNKYLKDSNSVNLVFGTFHIEAFDRVRKKPLIINNKKSALFFSDLIKICKRIKVRDELIHKLEYILHLLKLNT